MSSDKTVHWKGKIPFEDYVANRLWSIDETAKKQLKATLETNDLLKKLLGTKKDTKKKPSFKDKVADLMDDGKLNDSARKS